VISAHFDHIGYVDGKVISGALDNASGISAMIQVANILNEKSKKKQFEMDIIFCAFNGEEEGLAGSKNFASSIKTLYNSLYNINIDCIGAIDGDKTSYKAKPDIGEELLLITFRNIGQ